MSCIYVYIIYTYYVYARHKLVSICSLVLPENTFGLSGKLTRNRSLVIICSLVLAMATLVD